MRPLFATLLLLAACTTADPTTSASLSAGPNGRASIGNTKLDYSYVCAGTTCTFTDRTQSGITWYSTFWQAFIFEHFTDGRPTAKYAIATSGDVTEWTYTFPSVVAVCPNAGTTCEYHVLMYKQAKSRTYWADSTIVLQP